MLWILQKKKGEKKGTDAPYFLLFVVAAAILVYKNWMMILEEFPFLYEIFSHILFSRM